MKFIRVLKASEEHPIWIDDYKFEPDSDCEWYYKIDNKNITVNLYEHTHEFNEENDFDDSWDGVWTVEVQSPMKSPFMRFRDFDSAEKYILDLINVLTNASSNEDAIKEVENIPANGGWK